MDCYCLRLNKDPYVKFCWFGYWIWCGDAKGREVRVWKLLVLKLEYEIYGFNGLCVCVWWGWWKEMSILSMKDDHMRLKDFVVMCMCLYICMLIGQRLGDYKPTFVWAELMVCMYA